MMFSIRRLPLTLTCIGLLTGGCTESKVEVYTETTAARFDENRESSADGPAHLSWSRPKTWTELPKNALERARYGRDNSNGEISRTTIAWAACTPEKRVQAINGHRKSIGLPPLSSTEMESLAVRGELEGYQTLRYRIESPDHKGLDRIEIFFLISGDFTWSFVMKYSSLEALEELKSFESLLGSIALIRGKKEGVLRTSLEGKPSITYQTPRGWVEKENREPRIATLAIESEGLPPADFAVLLFSEGSESQLANLNRWRKMIGLDDWTTQQASENKRIHKAKSGDFILFEFGNKDVGEPLLNSESMRVAFLYKGDNTWVFRLQGDPLLLDTHKERFLAFLDSVSIKEASL